MNTAPHQELYCARRLVTCDAARDGIGVVEDGALLLAAGQVVAVGEGEALRAAHPNTPCVMHDGVMTPGLIDAHTHAMWLGSRGHEYSLRMAGADYETIARAGGGIVSSMHAIRGAAPEALERALVARLRRMAALGVTTVEVKSGYGLDEPSERAQLLAIHKAAGRHDLPAVVPTYLALHALPPEAAGDRDGYARGAIHWLERIAADGLARFVDAYVDRAAFSVAQAEPLLERARQLGLGVRVHAGQFADVGGAEMAARLGAGSIDHVEHIGAEGIAAVARAEVAAVLLPTASFTLGQAPPPVAALRDAGVRLVVASDANPGTAPTESLQLAMALAIRSYGLTPEEVLLGVTRHAARSLDVEGGQLRPGAAADLVLWDLAHEHDLLCPWGSSRAGTVLRAGQVIAGRKPTREKDTHPC